MPLKINTTWYNRATQNLGQWGRDTFVVGLAGVLVVLPLGGLIHSMLYLTLGDRLLSQGLGRKESRHTLSH